MDTVIGLRLERLMIHS